MNHVHWWLVGLSFVMGLVLTSALILRPPKGSSLLEQPVEAVMAGVAEASGPGPTALEWPTVPSADALDPVSPTVVEDVPPAVESATSEFAAIPEPPPARKPPPAKRSSAKNASPTKAPPAKRPRPAKNSPAKRPKLPYAPYGPGSARAFLYGCQAVRNGDVDLNGTCQADSGDATILATGLIWNSYNFFATSWSGSHGITINP